MKSKYIYVSIFILLLCVPQGFSQENAQDIIRKLENNRIFSGLYVEGTIIVKDKFGVRETDFILKSKDTNYSLLEYTSTAEKGQKVLRVDKKVYLYYPDAEQVITLNTSMMKQSMLDSDLSYEDLSGERSVLDKFTVELEGEEEKDGHDTYRLYLSAINDKKETYPYQRIWVRKDTYTVQEAEYYTRRKKLRKRYEALDVIALNDNRYIVSEMLFKDVLKGGDGTTIVLSSVALQEQSDSVFSVSNLKF